MAFFFFLFSFSYSFFNGELFLHSFLFLTFYHHQRVHNNFRSNVSCRISLYNNWLFILLLDFSFKFILFRPALFFSISCTTELSLKILAILRLASCQPYYLLLFIIISPICHFRSASPSAAQPSSTLVTCTFLFLCGISISLYRFAYLESQSFHMGQ